MFPSVSGSFILSLTLIIPSLPPPLPSFFVLLYYGLFDARLYSLRNPIALFISRISVWLCAQIDGAFCR